MGKKKEKFMKIPKYILAVDPDTKHQAYVVMDLGGKVINAFVIKNKTGSEYDQAKAHNDPNLAKISTGDFICVIEGQQVYKDDKKSNPADLIKLARSSGMAAAYAASVKGCIGIEVVLPQKWKGSVSKHAKQADILRKLGQEPEVRGSGNSRYCVPKDNFLNMNMTEYKHIVDAIGIAQWKIDQINWELKKARHKNL